MEAPIGKTKELKAADDWKQGDKQNSRARSGSQSEYAYQKKKASAMQKTYLEDA